MIGKRHKKHIIIFRWIGLALGFLAVTGCYEFFPPKPRKEPEPSVQRDTLVFQTGVASWYGTKFHGRRTANGEIYDMYKLTAAHQTLPFHTFVEVTNTDNNNRVVVRINDRGPFVKNRIIDLSRKAAARIGIVDNGTAPVILRIVKPGAPEPKQKITRTLPPVTPVETETETIPVEIAGGFYVQAGAFSSQQNAGKLLKQIMEITPQFKFEIYFKEGFYKIISPRFVSRENADRIKEILSRNNIQSFVKELD